MGNPKHPYFINNKRAYVDSVNYANRDKEWVRRLYYNNPKTIANPLEPNSGYRSTHLMGSSDNYAYPTIVNNNGNLSYLGDNAYEYAMRTNTAIKFPNNEQADWYAANGYKQGTNVLKFNGGLNNKNMNYISYRGKQLADGGVNTPPRISEALRRLLAEYGRKLNPTPTYDPDGNFTGTDENQFNEGFAQYLADYYPDLHKEYTNEFGSLTAEDGAKGNTYAKDALGIETKQTNSALGITANQTSKDIANTARSVQNGNYQTSNPSAKSKTDGSQPMDPNGLLGKPNTANSTKPKGKYDWLSGISDATSIVNRVTGNNKYTRPGETETGNLLGSTIRTGVSQIPVAGTIISAADTVGSAIGDLTRPTVTPYGTYYQNNSARGFHDANSVIDTWSNSLSNIGKERSGGEVVGNALNLLAPGIPSIFSGMYSNSLDKRDTKRREEEAKTKLWNDQQRTKKYYDKYNSFNSGRDIGSYFANGGVNRTPNINEDKIITNHDKVWDYAKTSDGVWLTRRKGTDKWINLNQAGIDVMEGRSKTSSASKPTPQGVPTKAIVYNPFPLPTGAGNVDMSAYSSANMNRLTANPNIVLVATDNKTNTYKQPNSSNKKEVINKAVPKEHSYTPMVVINKSGVPDLEFINSPILDNVQAPTIYQPGIYNAEIEARKRKLEQDKVKLASRDISWSDYAKRGIYPFAQGGISDNNLPEDNSIPLDENAELVVNNQGGTQGTHEEGQNVPLYNNNGQQSGEVEPGEVVVELPNKQQFTLSKRLGTAQVYMKLVGVKKQLQSQLVKESDVARRGTIEKQIDDIDKKLNALPKLQEGYKASQGMQNDAGQLGFGGIGGEDEERMTPYDPFLIENLYGIKQDEPYTSPGGNYSFDRGVSATITPRKQIRVMPTDYSLMGPPDDASLHTPVKSRVNWKDVGNNLLDTALEFSPLIDNIANNNIAKQMMNTPMPVPEQYRYKPTNTNYDINANLNNINNTAKQNKNYISKNSSSVADAIARMNNVNLSTYAPISQLYQTKNNVEHQWEAMNNQGINNANNANVDLRNKYALDNYGKTMEGYSKISQNMANIKDDLTRLLTRRDMNKYQKQQLVLDRINNMDTGSFTELMNDPTFASMYKGIISKEEAIQQVEAWKKEGGKDRHISIYQKVFGI